VTFKTMRRWAAAFCAAAAGIVFTEGSASAQCRGGQARGRGPAMMTGGQSPAMMYSMMMYQNQQYAQLAAQQQNMAALAALQLQQLQNNPAALAALQQQQQNAAALAALQLQLQQQQLNANRRGR
jgi:hypothetical protein